ncbi:threonine synthase [Algisphaera agarilytica]|uniref:Threonine synthase n=1 Tax=Algisphaera agarilytica TaxID=1385975 RepID=A0A7X0LJD9_9BACT|nr:threonine synthase [Algisphaera agarilytica]MBB6428669.1 threonine synthase [Algisphaera agarilytica]
MRYISTRGAAAPLEFEDVLLEGLARDGGLYVPESWPTISPDEIAAMADWPYEKVAQRIMQPFVPAELAEALPGIIEKAYGTFRSDAVTPMISLGGIQDGLHLMELFHGPTLAFKDVAMQVLGGLFEHVLAKRDERVTIIGATSGDTGSAAIEAVRGRERARIFILHPHGRTSDVQRKQMTTVDAPNVFNIALEGTFDDCQNLLKAMFNDETFRDRVSMSGVNSINWARLMPQIVYYFIAALKLHGPDAATKPTSFSVPTGNFGDIYAGYAAAKMGLPVERLVIASNQNDILTRVMNTGEHTLGPVAKTIAPSMDIQISSNFERLMFDMLGRDGGAVAQKMSQLKDDGTFTLPEASLDTVRGLFGAHRADEQETLDAMKRAHDVTGELLDPHTAIGVVAALADMQSHPSESSTPMVVLGTAHPAKFPAAVERATGQTPPLPEFLGDLYEREERYDVLPNDLAAVQAYVAERV